MKFQILCYCNVVCMCVSSRKLRTQDFVYNCLGCFSLFVFLSIVVSNIVLTFQDSRFEYFIFYFCFINCNIKFLKYKLRDEIYFLEIKKIPLYLTYVRLSNIKHLSTKTKRCAFSSHITHRYFFSDWSNPTFQIL